VQICEKGQKEPLKQQQTFVSQVEEDVNTPKVVRE
jgi:hypothetical protein